MLLKDYNEYEGTTPELNEEAYRKMFGGYANGFFVVEDGVDNSKRLSGKTRDKKSKKASEEKTKTRMAWDGGGLI